MKLEYEIIHPDEGSSFRLVHVKEEAGEIHSQLHYHPEYEIDYVISGTGSLQIANHIEYYQSGDTVLLGPNLPHTSPGSTGEGLHDMIVLHLSEEVLKQSILTRPEMSELLPMLDNARYGIIFKGRANNKIQRELNRLLTLNSFEKFMHVLALLQCMAQSKEYKLLSPSLIFSSTVYKNNLRLQNIFKFIEEHYQEEIPIREVAHIANLSVPSFCNYFKKHVHATFTEVVNHYRIQQACILLQQDKTIAEASFECGFNNVVYFNKVFRHVMNTTPSSYRKAKQNRG